MTTTGTPPPAETPDGPAAPARTGEQAPATAPSLDHLRLPVLSAPSVLLTRGLVLVAFVFGLYLLDQIANVLLDFWLLESLGYEQVFWTNFQAAALIFALTFLAFGAAVAMPALLLGNLGRSGRLRALLVAGLIATYAGYAYLHRFPDYLLWANGGGFGTRDPVYDNDIGFYVFDLPAIWTTMHILTLLGLTGLAASVTFAWIGRDRSARPADVGRVLGAVGQVARPLTLAWVAFLGLVLAVDTWLRRYGLLNADNYDASIPSGAQAIDVTGLFSTKNAILVEALVLLATTVAVILRLRAARRAATGAPAASWRPAFTRGALALLLLPGLSVDIAFRAAVAVRSQIEITPNEPVVQYPFIKRHIDATNTAYGLDKIERKSFVPKGPGDPAPDADELATSATVANVPLWPGYNTWLERLIDPEYVERLFLQPPGDTTIYGPTLATFQQQEKLRPYYDFMDVDTVRYRTAGGPRLFASSARELPLVEPKPWLAWWGQRFVVFTHGHGLVMTPVGAGDDKGEPAYASSGIPTRVTDPALKPGNESLYYAEGAGSMAYSNLRGIQEHDRPTDDGREQISFPDGVDAGVRLDSWIKRLAFGFKSRQFLDIVASDLIDEGSRVHFYRTPLERLEHLAPFLYNDTDPYAVNRGDGISWMVNSMTTTTRYPYSAMGELGDKADRRSPTPRPTRDVNYVRDAVKATVDAYTGKVDLYKFADEPIINAWAKTYPDLFKDRAEMPEPLADQVQYPPQLFHLQFDDLYIYYHQKDALTFFSQEDVFDDGDEVVGPVLSDGEAISFSIEPYYWMPKTGSDLPKSSDETQFAMSMVFTPENALNLRAIATAYMEGEDYGRLSILELPKGRYFPGPEQADSAIDQDPFISQQLGLWQRQGLEVIRGHTTPLVIDGDVLYVEPLFIRSKQNPLPRLERVIVVYRGKATMQTTLEQALRAAVQPGAQFPIRPGPELGGEPAFGADGRIERPDAASLGRNGTSASP